MASYFCEKSVCGIHQYNHNDIYDIDEYNKNSVKINKRIYLLNIHITGLGDGYDYINNHYIDDTYITDLLKDTHYPLKVLPKKLLINIFRWSCHNHDINAVNFILHRLSICINEGINPKKLIYINQVDKGDETPFMKACITGDVKISKQILKFVSKYDEYYDVHNFINVKNNFNNTPFTLACHNGHYNIVKLLLNYNCTCGETCKCLNEKRKCECYTCKKCNCVFCDFYDDNCNQTYYDKCLNNCHCKNCNFLTSGPYCGGYTSCKCLCNCHCSYNCDCNFNINHQNKKGYTALMLAVKNNHMKVVEVLLRVKNINLNIKNRSGDMSITHSLNNYNWIISEQLIRDKRQDIKNIKLQLVTLINRLIKIDNIELYEKVIYTYEKRMWEIKFNIFLYIFIKYYERYNLPCEIINFIKNMGIVIIPKKDIEL